MANKHRRARGTGAVAVAPSILALDSAVRAYLGSAVPRHVIANFDRWCDAVNIGDVAGQARLAAVLRRAGFEAAVIYAVRNHTAYRLRRLK